MRRVAFVLLFALCAALAQAQKRILLVPLDSRPASGQFAQMIARMASVQVNMPPYETLGRYTSPGRPEAILDWLENQDLSQVMAVVVNADMIAYGGLIASRTNQTTQEIALARLSRLAAFHKKLGAARPLYVFSSIMRLFPTSTKQTNSYRAQLGRWAEAKDRYRRTGSLSALQTVHTLEGAIPPTAMADYLGARDRNHQVQRQLVKWTASGAFDYLILGQDDAQPYGPHIPEREALKSLVEKLSIGGRTYFCEGVDQLSNILVSRSLLKEAQWAPRVRIIYSDTSAKSKVANYESKNIEQSLRDQLLASGARPWISGEYDYTLWLNAPNPDPEKFSLFLNELSSEVDQGFPSGVADINLGKTGSADPKLFDDLWQHDRMVHLLSYAGWNTAGNTIGTSVPAANVYLLARRLGTDPLKREVSQREFVLHRFVNDFAYHNYTRPEAYRLIDSLPGATREETYGEDFQALNNFVRKELEVQLQKFFSEQFMGKRFFAGTQEYVLTGLDQVKINLPWPRAYEVRLEFRLQTAPVASETRKR